MPKLDKDFLGKCVWRFALEADSWGKRVIDTKYGNEDHGWRSKVVQGSFGVGFWKEILKESGWVSGNCKFRIVNDTKISFWTNYCVVLQPSVIPSQHYMS